MIRAKNLQFLLLFKIVEFYSMRPSFCNGTSTSNICENSGKCGPFGVCDSQASPICSCLQGFDPRNNQEWGSGNWTSGCVRRVPLSCEGHKGTNGDGREDGFLNLPVMIQSGSSDRWFGPVSQCEGRCRTNCSCLAYAFDSTGCGFWTEPLIGILKSPTDSGSVTYVRLANSELDHHKKNSKKIIVILVVVVGFLIIFTCAYFSWKWIAKHKASARRPFDTSFQDAESQVNNEDVPLFKFEILANATNNFSEDSKLGAGGFGPVYKGELADGREVAVKRLSKASGQGMQEFMNEVRLISKLQHRNLVRLLGCCVEKKEMMLIYEYMPNKSLDFFLIDSSQEILDWRKRFNIIEGVCLGLLYLHRDSRLKIIHRDLKPNNILLDNDWSPKISDFGLARIFGTKQDHVSTKRVVGTYGYMAPEYAMKGRFSEKSDVFSFGVMILEIATGRRNKSFRQDGYLNLLGYVWNVWNEGNIRILIDPRISNLSNLAQSEVLRCIHVGLLCVQELPEDRPSISTVLSMLSSEIMMLPEPKQPAFAVKPSTFQPGTSSSQQTQMGSSSINNLSITTIDGR